MKNCFQFFIPINKIYPFLIVHMLKHLEQEWIEFKQYHKNQFNISFHILCGIIYMSAFFLLFRQYKNILLLLYSILLFTSKIPIHIILTIYITIFFIINYSPLTHLSYKYLIFTFFIFYFAPDLSHYITKEKTVLNIHNITLLKIFFNIFYLLPFSILCLTNQK